MNTQTKFASTPDPPLKWIKKDGVVYAVLKGGPPLVVVGLLTGEVFKTQRNRSTPNVYAEAASRELETVDQNLELGQRFVLTFTKEDMEMMGTKRVAIMHELVGYTGLLPKIDSWVSGNKLEVSMVQAQIGGLWDMDFGNLFVVPERLYPRLIALGLQIP